jgi:hypothetical protein
MVAIQTIAIFLLIARLISVVFIGMVLYLQSRLFGTKIDFSLVPNLSKFQKRNIYLARKVLFTLSVVIFLGNLIPIVIDTLTIFSDNAAGRNPEGPTISIMYAFSNALTAMFSAIMIWGLYKLAGLGGDQSR